MNSFNEYIETKIAELSEEAENLEKNYQKDDAVFVRIKINVFNICKTVLDVFEKNKPENTLYNEYTNKLDEFEKIWSANAGKAKKFGDMKTVAAEEAKLSVLAEIKEKYIESRDEAK